MNKKKKTIKPFGLWMEPLLQESAISVTNVHKGILLQIPSWIIKKLRVILPVNKLHKTKTHPNTYLENFHTILLYHPEHQYLFTDGSKDINQTAWIPSHIGVSGNERAVSAAKSALDLNPEVISVPYTDLKPTISKFLHTKWQQRWDNNIHNKLFQIQPTLGEWRRAFRKSRREQVVISWLRIGHTRLLHSFMLKHEPQP